MVVQLYGQNQKMKPTKTYPVRSDLLNITIKERIDNTTAKKTIPNESPKFCCLLSERKEKIILAKH